MKTFKITLALGLIILIAAGLLFPLPQPALAQEETPQPESTHKTYLPIIPSTNLRRLSNPIRLGQREEPLLQ